MMKFEKKRVNIGKEELAYIDVGTGETLILVHGNMSSSVHFLPLIEKLQDTYRVVVPDLRGFGDSTYNESFDSLCEVAEDVKMFADALKIESAYVAGWSTGGGIVMDLAAKYPDFVKSLFIIQGTSHKGYPIFKKDATYQPIIGEAYATKAEMATDPVQVAPAVAMMDNNDADGMTNIWNFVIYNVNKPSKEDNDFYMAESMKQRCILDTDWALATFNMSPEKSCYSEGTDTIKDIKCKCAFTKAMQDITVPYTMVMENVDAMGDLATVYTYENCAHSIIVDNLDQLVEDMKNFF